MTYITQQFGGFNDKTLMAVDYEESVESGLADVRRKYKADESGWMREYEVHLVILYWKRDQVSVLAAVPTQPSSLTTTAGKNSDGTAATRLAWGAGYTLSDISTSAVKGSPSICKSTCIYTKSVSEAQDSYPDNLTITCSSGVYSVVWQGETFFEWDNGTGSCGTDGVEFVKMPQRKKLYRVTREVNGKQYQKTENRFYAVLEIRVDGVTISEHEVLLKTSGQSDDESVVNETIGEELVSTVDQGTDYAAELTWYSDGDICRLIWCDEIILDMEIL